MGDPAPVVKGGNVWRGSSRHDITEFGNLYVGGVVDANGKAAVVLDAAAYQRLLDIAASASAAEGIRQGAEDTAAGRVRSARGVRSSAREIWNTALR
jgi:hypothetical protein